MRDEQGLTLQQRKFVEGYISLRNATEAYRQAGYKAKNDNVLWAAASRLLRNVKVAAEIVRRREELARKFDIDHGQVLKETALLAHSDPGEVFDFSREEVTMMPACLVPEHARRAISSIKVKRDHMGNHSIDIRWHSKQAALALLHEYLIGEDVQKQAELTDDQFLRRVRAAIERSRAERAGRIVLQPAGDSAGDSGAGAKATEYVQAPAAVGTVQGQAAGEGISQ